MLVLILILVILVLLLLLLSMVWPPDAPWSPWWRTSGKLSHTICEFLQVGKTDIVFDLGSGDGTFLITAAKQFNARCVGIEIDPLRSTLSRIMVWLSGVSGKVTIVRKNFFQADISDATIVFMYLVPKALNELKPKLLQEMKPGTRIVTFVYMIDMPIAKQDTKNEIYVYTVPKRSPKE